MIITYKDNENTSGYLGFIEKITITQNKANKEKSTYLETEGDDPNRRFLKDFVIKIIPENNKDNLFIIFKKDLMLPCKEIKQLANGEFVADGIKIDIRDVDYITDNNPG